jgi:hypothetical protein
MHGPLNVKSMSCLFTSGRNILLGEEEKGNEQLLCVRKKKYFHFMLNECSCLEYHSLYVGVLNTKCLFAYLRIGD